ncbi:MAG: hypothetical protein ACLUI3_10805 [Christensenellales bacterium]
MMLCTFHPHLLSAKFSIGPVKPQVINMGFARTMSPSAAGCTSCPSPRWNSHHQFGRRSMGFFENLWACIQ